MVYRGSYRTCDGRESIVEHPKLPKIKYYCYGVDFQRGQAHVGPSPCSAVLGYHSHSEQGSEAACWETGNIWVEARCHTIIDMLDCVCTHCVQQRRYSVQCTHRPAATTWHLKETHEIKADVKNIIELERRKMIWQHTEHTPLFNFAYCRKASETVKRSLN